MARGFLSGAIWGSVLSLGGLSALSVLAPGPVPQAPAPVVQTDIATPEPGPAAADTTDTDADPAATTEVPTEPQGTAAEEGAADLAEGAPPADLPMLAEPVIPQDVPPEDSVAVLSPPPGPAETVDPLAEPETPDAPGAIAGRDPDPSPDTAPIPPLTIPPSEVAPEAATEPAQPPAPQAPTEAAPESAAVQSADEALAAEPDPDAAASTGDDTPVTAERPQVRRLVPATPDESTPDAAAGSDAGVQRPAIGRPAASLIDGAAGGTGRLPSITADAGDGDAAAAPDTAPPVADARPPLLRYAAPVATDPGLPRMSVILMDDGTGPLGPDTLDGFPFPVTFALDPAAPDAAARMSAYRARGYEVAALVSLPVAAQPGDVEQVLAGVIAVLPEVVALVEAPDGGLQASRAVTEQAAGFLAESGHGLVFLPNGLNTAQAIAERAAVPTLSIMRDFDGDGQDARTKRRFLDGAAFRARQDGTVAMLGRLTPDTLSALLLWSLQDRASSVAMVPVSALLQDSAAN